MTPRSSSPTPSQPLPTLPVELWTLILAECDQPTLAVACRVSSEFLEIVSALLYRHVELQSLHQVGLLLCNLPELPSSATVSHFLRLDQVRSVFVKISFKNAEETLVLSRQRLPSGNSLQLDTLHVCIDAPETDGLLDGLEQMVEMLDPAEAIFRAGINAEFMYLPLGRSWMRVRYLELDNCISSDALTEYTCFASRGHRTIRCVFRHRYLRGQGDYNASLVLAEELFLLHDEEPSNPAIHRLDIAICLSDRSKSFLHTRLAIQFESSSRFLSVWEAITFEQYPT